MIKSKLVLFLLALPFAVKAQMFTDIAPDNPFASGYFPTIMFVDVDNDGDADIVISRESGMTVFYNDDLDFSRNSFFEDFITERQAPSVMDLGDFDLDGKVDILSGGGPNYSTFRVLLNKDPEYQESTGAGSLGPIRSPASFADFDNDGDLDVLREGGIAENVGDSLSYSFYWLNARDIISEHWVDLDKDGRVETLLNSGSYGTYNTYILKKDSGNHFPIQKPVTNLNTWFDGARFADIDADGDMDMLIRTLNWNFQIFFNNSNNGTFSEGPIFPSGSTAEIADMNNDGKYDIVVAGAMDTWQVFQVQIFSNNGDHTFTRITDTGIQDTNQERPDIDLGDVDNDGDLDLAIVLNSKLYRNETAAINAAPGVPINLSEKVTSGYALFRWSAPTDDHTTEFGLTYNVDVRKADGTIITSSNSLPNGKRLITKMGNAYNNTIYRLGCLQEGSYKWSVQALDAAYVGSAFSTERPFTVTDVAPAPPSNLTSKGISDKAVQLSWSDGSDNETAYVIQKKDVNQNRYFDIDTVAANVTSYIDSMYLQPNTSYSYRVVARNCAYLSEYHSDAEGSTLPKFFEESGVFPTFSVTTKFLLADADNDGDLDALVSDNGSGSSSIIKYDGSTFMESGIALPKITWPQFAQWADLNGDGYYDLFTSLSEVFDLKLRIYINDHGNGFIEKEIDLDVPFDGLPPSSPSFADFDNDGDMDMLLLTYPAFSTSQSMLKLFRNKGNLKFEDTGFDLPGVVLNSSPWADYDLDGDPDILVKTSGGDCGAGVIAVLENKGASFELVVTNIGGIVADLYSQYGNLTWMEINNDGYPDIFYAGRQGCSSDNSGAITIINNKFKGFYNSYGADKVKGVYENVDIKAGDLNLDGWQDVVIYGEPYSGAPGTRVYFNINGTFEPPNVMITNIDYLIDASQYGGLEIGDIDQDDDLDVLIGGVAGWWSDPASIAYQNNMVDAWYGVNEAPSAPVGLNVHQLGDQLIFAWSVSDDDTTPSEALTYEVYAIIDGDSVLLCNSNSDGSRKIVAAGTNGSLNTKSIKLPKPGTLQWGVQAIDASFKASPFASMETVIEPVGLDDERTNFQVYPNPAKEKLFVSGSDSAPQMFDVVGRRIDLQFQNDDNTYKANTQSIKPGLYIIRAQIGDRSYSKKILIE